jgi:hypothetical protein
MEQDYTDLIHSFHETWDTFPGVARIVDRFHHTLAVNPFAEKQGMKVGEICAERKSPENHRGCLKRKVLSTGKAGIDRPSEGKIRGWLPVKGYPDVVIHFSLTLPEVAEWAGK